jgi:hypothetical protein
MLDLALVVTFLTSMLAICIGAAMSASGSPLLPVFEVCCLFAIGLVVILELRPRVVAVRARMAAVRRFREQLDAIPEAAHPLDPVPRPRSKRSG